MRLGRQLRMPNVCPMPNMCSLQVVQSVSLWPGAINRLPLPAEVACARLQIRRGYLVLLSFFHSVRSALATGLIALDTPDLW